MLLNGSLAHWLLFSYLSLIGQDHLPRDDMVPSRVRPAIPRIDQDGASDIPQAHLIRQFLNCISVNYVRLAIKTNLHTAVAED